MRGVGGSAQTWAGLWPMALLLPHKTDCGHTHPQSQVLSLRTQKTNATDTCTGRGSLSDCKAIARYSHPHYESNTPSGSDCTNSNLNTSHKRRRSTLRGARCAAQAEVDGDPRRGAVGREMYRRSARAPPLT